MRLSVIFCILCSFVPSEAWFLRGETKFCCEAFCIPLIKNLALATAITWSLSLTSLAGSPHGKNEVFCFLLYFMLFCTCEAWFLRGEAIFCCEAFCIPHFKNLALATAITWSLSLTSLPGSPHGKNEVFCFLL